MFTIVFTYNIDKPLPGSVYSSSVKLRFVDTLEIKSGSDEY